MKNLTLLSLFKLAIKHIFVLMIAAFVLAGLVFSYCRFIAVPKYSAKGSILVTNGAIIDNFDRYEDFEGYEGYEDYEDSMVYNSDIVASINFASTVVDILETNGIYRQLSESIENKYTYKQLSSFTTIERSGNNSLFIEITFTTSDKKEAIRLVNKYLELAPEYINSFVPGCAAAVSEADDSQKVSPNTTLSTLIAAIFGAGITFVIILFIYASNTVILGENDFKERFDLPVIGTVPDFSKSKIDKTYGGYGDFIRKGLSKNG